MNHSLLFALSLWCSEPGCLRRRLFRFCFQVQQLWMNRSFLSPSQKPSKLGLISTSYCNDFHKLIMRRCKKCFLPPVLNLLSISGDTHEEQPCAPQYGDSQQTFVTLQLNHSRSQITLMYCLEFLWPLFTMSAFIILIPFDFCISPSINIVELSRQQHKGVIVNNYYKQICTFCSSY